MYQKFYRTNQYNRTQSNCNPKSYQKLSTVLLKEERDRLIAEVEQINDELARRGERVESESVLVRAENPQLTNKLSPGGWLDPYTVVRSKKEHPVVLGNRDKSNPKHFYWKYRWVDDGKVRSQYLPQKKVDAVRKAIARNATSGEILKLLKGGDR